MMKKTKTNYPQNSWSDLPTELLEAIADRLGTQFDTCNFRAVCKQWQQSTEQISSIRKKSILHPLLPHDITRDASFISGKIDPPAKFLRLVATRTFLVSTIANPEKKPWLVTLEEYDRGRVHIRRPFSRVAVERYELPEAVMELSGFRVIELFNGYCFRFRDYLKDMIHPCFLYDHRVSKVVLLSNPASGSNTTIHDYTVFVLHNDGELLALNLKRDELGFESSFFHRYDYNAHKMVKFDDAVVFMNKIYVIDCKGRLYSIRYGSSTLEKVVDYVAMPKSFLSVSGCKSEKPKAKKEWRKYLVLDKEDLYLVYGGFNIDQDKMKIRVCKLDASKQRWKLVKSIGNHRVLFVTGEGCFFALARDLPGWKGNCVVFPRESFAPFKYVTSIADLRYLAWTAWCSAQCEIDIYHFVNLKNGKDKGRYNYTKPLDITHDPRYFDLFVPPQQRSSDTYLPGGSSEDDDEKESEDEDDETKSEDEDNITESEDSEEVDQDTKDVEEDQDTESADEGERDMENSEEGEQVIEDAEEGELDTESAEQGEEDMEDSESEQDTEDGEESGQDMDYSEDE